MTRTQKAKGPCVLEKSSRQTSTNNKAELLFLIVLSILLLGLRFAELSLISLDERRNNSKRSVKPETVICAVQKL